MNEKLWKLAEQCYEKHELLGTYEFNKEKFAELIVRECIGEIESLKENCGPKYLAGLDFAAETIQKHFGVDE